MAVASVETSTIRTFLALPLASSFEKEVEPIILRLKKEYPEVRWVQPTEIHITLHFFGDITKGKISETSKLIAPIVSKTKPFQISLKGLGSFPDSKRPRVIWMGIKGDVEPLIVLQNAIEKILKQAGFPCESRSFKPHLTLGRVKFPKRQIHFQQNDFQTTSPKRMDAIVLFQSHMTPQGAHYETLETFPFSQA